MQTPAAVKAFLLAGNATFTIDNGSGRHLTFNIGKGKDPEPGGRYRTAPYFASVHAGSDTYNYMGMLDQRTGKLRQTKGSKVGERSQAWIVLSWALRRIWSGKLLPAPARLMHAGNCGRCGRQLTDPVSIATGIGPDCAEQMGIDRTAMMVFEPGEQREPGSEG